ncbi:hypothetical protein GUITHDRAFT_151827, partial [Guillardia theta CCMP2712]
MKPSVNTRSALPEEYKKKRRLLEKEEYDRLTERKPGFLDWLSVKQQQYNITSVLYMLDWWERFLFNIFLISVMLGTVFAMYIYSQSSGLLLALSILLMGIVVLLLLLCPLHQY